MAVLGRILVSSAERLDLPDLLSIDSYAAGDWKYFMKGIVGDSKPYILKGFDVIDPENAVGTQSCSIRVADSIVFYPGSTAGPFFHGLEEGNEQAIPLVPELRKNAVNYVYLTLTTQNTASDSRAFWDEDKDGGVGGEFTQDVNTESILKAEVNVSVGSFPINTIPVAKITVGAVVITKIEDARDLMFRLGSGGLNPNPFNTYNWRSLPAAGYERHEPPTAIEAGGVNPFQGADKNIRSLKEWMDVVMSKLKELGGTAYWYEDASTTNLVTSFIDMLATTFKSKGKWIHDSSTPGVTTWTEDINIKITADPRTYIVRNGTVTLADEQVAYLPLTRNAIINPTDDAVAWTNGQAYVNTIGGVVGSFQNLTKGDWIKKVDDPNSYFLRVEEFYDAVNLGGSVSTAANAKSIRLSSTYLGTTSNAKARYDKGVYPFADVVVSDRNALAINSAGGNFHWMVMRSDTIENVSSIVSTALTIDITEHDGTTAKVTASGAHGLIDGDRVTITGSTNFNGTYLVEVESSTVFYINKTGGPFANELGKSAFYATVTTSARSTLYGLQLESANHGFNSNDTIIVAGTTNFNGSFLIKKRSATTFTIPVSSNIATESAGTATLAKVLVRVEQGTPAIVQGESVDFGNLPSNLKSFIGMQSDAESYPQYAVPPSYNTLDGMQNYNGLSDDSLTTRASKLSAMMADKAQDKTIKYNYGTSLTTVINTTNGAAQEVTFTAPGSILYITTPGSNGQAAITLPSVSPGVSLLVNQAAYIRVDRNDPSTPSITVTNIESVPVDEDVFVILTRLAATDIYLWDGHPIPVGSYVLEKADRDLGNLTAPTRINQDLNPDFFTDANNRQIGSINPFSKINSPIYSGDYTVYTLTGDFNTGSNLITNITGTMPAYTGGLYTIYAPGGYTDGDLGIASFDSPTQITLNDPPDLSGTGVTFYVTAATVVKSENQTAKSGAVALFSGNASAGSSGVVGLFPGDATPTHASVTFQGNVYQAAPFGHIGNIYSVQNIVDGTLVPLSSGTVQANANVVYVITNYVAGDNFTNIGGTNATGSIFRPTGTTPTTWTNGSTLQPLVIAGTGVRVINRISATTTRDEILSALNILYLISHDFVVTSAGGANVTQTNGTGFLSGAEGYGDVVLGADVNTGVVEVAAPYINLSKADPVGQVYMTTDYRNGAVATDGLNINSGNTGGSGTSGQVTIKTGEGDGGGGTGNLSLRTGVIRAGVASGQVNISTGVNTPLATANTGNTNISTGAVQGLAGNSGNVTVNTGNIVNFANTSTSGSVTIFSGNVTANTTSTATTGTVNLSSGTSVSNSTGASGAVNINSGNLTGTGSGVSGNVTIRSGNKTNASATNPSGSTTLTTGNNSGSGNSGSTTISTGTTVTGTSGAISVQTGTPSGASAPSGNININTGPTNNGASGAANLFSGNVSGNNGSGNVTVLTGNGTGGGSFSGTLTVASGNTLSQNTGNVTVKSGDITSGAGPVSTGQLTLKSGNSQSSNGSGQVFLNSGNITSGTGPSGQITIATGTVQTNANSGDIFLNTADVSGTGVKGKIRLGNSSTAGYIWTAVDGTGGGAWVDPYAPDTTSPVTIANNQAVVANVPGLLFNGAVYRSFTVEYWVYRTTNTNELAESGVIRGVYSTISGTWQISISGIAGDAQVDFSITSGGQVQYISSNLAGSSYSGTMKFATVMKIPV